MARPWETIDRADTPEGALELRRRGARDFLITVGGRVLMNSATNRSELVLGAEAARAVADRPAPRVLVGGLGMGYTLRAVLDGPPPLPPAAAVVVAELTPQVVDWCRGPLAALTDDVLADPRVRVEVADVAALVRDAAAQGGAARYDAIVLDLFEGPHAASQAEDDPFYGRAALHATRAALRPGGVFLVWGEAVDPAFERRLAATGFRFERQRPGRGGLRHAVWLAR